MITKNYRIPDYKLNYPLQEKVKPEDVLFLDIETTGFSAATSSIYLIGCCFYKNGEWDITQWLCESLPGGDSREEEILLKTFLSFLKDYKTLIHFNGNRFDLPFIEKRCEKYGLKISFSDFDGIDIYKRVYPYRYFLHLANCKQKTMEEFMGIQRTDRYSGGELIHVFRSFCNTHDNEAMELLLQHNRDDVYGMLRLLPILSYVDFYHDDFHVNRVEIETDKDVFGKDVKEANIYFSSSVVLPRPVSCHGMDCYFTGKNSKGLIKVPVFEEEMKYFYSDYKNYYYLPGEDMAIHKSVAAYVDPAFREQATAANCYTRKYAEYLPQWDTVFTPFFKREYQSPNLFFELTDKFKNNREAFNTYIHHILNMMIANH